jgi:hypothetical protein
MKLDLTATVPATGFTYNQQTGQQVPVVKDTPIADLIVAYTDKMPTFTESIAVFELRKKAKEAAEIYKEMAAENEFSPHPEDFTDGEFRIIFNVALQRGTDEKMAFLDCVMRDNPDFDVTAYEEDALKNMRPMYPPGRG